MVSANKIDYVPKDIHDISKIGYFKKRRAKKAIRWLLSIAPHSIITDVTSAFLDNVTTVLLIVPVIFSITYTLRVKAFPFLMAMIFASNIGGTATLIGDPPNIMIGSSTGLIFMDFVRNNTHVIIDVQAATSLPII